ncbi:MAG: hypothetical protein ABI354_02040, partial [Candidatus Saccharimonadales bacterium]
MQVAITNRTKLILFVFSLLIFAFCLQGKTSALSSRGPDLVDLGKGSSEKAGYVLVDTSAASIRQISIPLYFTAQTGNSVTVVGGDLCASDGNPNAYRDRNNPKYSAGTTIASYSVGSNVVSGVVKTNWPCEDGGSGKTIGISSSSLALDSSSGLYKGIFIAQVPWDKGNIENVFHIEASNGGIVGYSSDNTAQGFGIEQESPQDTYRDYKLPFAPDCSVKGTATASIDIYDPDNGTAGVQPEKFNVSIYDETTGTNVVLTPHIGTDSGVYSPGASNGQHYPVKFTVKTGHKYVFEVNHVYSVNILQFSLPFDSIYYLTGCKAPVPTCDITGVPATIEQGGTFTAKFKLTNSSPYTKMGSLNPPNSQRWGTGMNRVSIIGDAATATFTAVYQGDNQDFSWGLVNDATNVWYGGWKNPTVLCTKKITVTPSPIRAACNNLKIEPRLVEAGRTAKISVDANISGGTAGPQKYNTKVTISGPTTLSSLAGGTILSGPAPGVTYDGRLSSAPISFGITPTKVGKYDVTVTINFTGAN